MLRAESIFGPATLRRKVLILRALHIALICVHLFRNFFSRGGGRLFELRLWIVSKEILGLLREGEVLTGIISAQIPLLNQ